MVDIEAANTAAVERMMEARPVLVGVARARDVVPGMADDLIMHAGPPVAWERMSGPQRGAVMGALIFEGRAKDGDEAVAIASSGQVRFEPCHHHASVGPMAGIISPSMMVYVVENRTHGNRAYSGLNEGYGKVLRMGAYAPEVIAKLRWMNDVMAPVLADALVANEGIDIRALLAEALHMGDEGHNRNKAASLLFLKALSPFVARCAPNPEHRGRNPQVPRRQRAQRAEPCHGRVQGDGGCGAWHRGQYHRDGDGAQRHRLWYPRFGPR